MKAKPPKAELQKVLGEIWDQALGAQPPWLLGMREKAALADQMAAWIGGLQYLSGVFGPCASDQAAKLLAEYDKLKKEGE